METGQRRRSLCISGRCCVWIWVRERCDGSGRCMRGSHSLRSTSRAVLLLRRRSLMVSGSIFVLAIWGFFVLISPEMKFGGMSWRQCRCVLAGAQRHRRPCMAVGCTTAAIMSSSHRCCVWMRQRGRNCGGQRGTTGATGRLLLSGSTSSGRRLCWRGRAAFDPMILTGSCFGRQPAVCRASRLRRLLRRTGCCM